MDRVTIKQTAKQQMRAQRPTAIKISVVIFIISALIGIVSSSRTVANVSALMGIESASRTVARPMIASIISIFVLLNINLGAANAYLQIWRGEETEVGNMFSIGFERYGRYLGGMLLVGLYTFLWSLLFFFPGIVKSFSYALTPYILREMPDLSVNQAIKLSSRMMDGHKMELFVVYLSFIGWYLLGAMTFYILTLGYVSPYMGITVAGFYDEVKKEAIASGIISPIEG